MKTQTQKHKKKKTQKRIKKGQFNKSAKKYKRIYLALICFL